MKRIWWSWDIRMRWSHGFSFSEESFLNNYRKAIDAAERYNVEGIVIWGFLRDIHGGVDSAKRICDYAHKKGVSIFPGVGIDAYGGVYYEGMSKYSLDSYLKMNPGAQAIDENGKPFTYRWPRTDKSERLVGCPSNKELMDFFEASLEWIIETFDLNGFQIEQGDVGLCQCNRCRSRKRTSSSNASGNTCMEDMSKRLVPLVRLALTKKPDLIIITEIYNGVTPEEIKPVLPFIKEFPEETYISWCAYDGPHLNNGFKADFKINSDSKSPTRHGNIAIRTNNDLFFGEIDDKNNINKAVFLAKKAGFDMTYIYGEYPDSWPITRANYETWAWTANSELTNPSDS